jgi:hypothetical protein
MKKVLMLLLLGFCSLQMNAWAQDCPPLDPNCTPGGNDDPPTGTIPEPSVIWLLAAAGLAGFGVSRLVNKRNN